ncbi:hypothetical protein K457DRAFT_1896668, partial [Linnemannia elongata AG-77]
RREKCVCTLTHDVLILLPLWLSGDLVNVSEGKRTHVGLLLLGCSFFLLCECVLLSAGAGQDGAGGVFRVQHLRRAPFSCRKIAFGVVRTGSCAGLDDARFSDREFVSRIRFSAVVVVVMNVSFLDRFGLFGDLLRLTQGPWNHIAIVADVGIGIGVDAGRDWCGGGERDDNGDHDHGREGE